MMATAKKTEAGKPNPFEKLKQAKAAEATSEEQVVSEAKERVAAKRATRTVKAASEPEEVEEEIEDADAEVLDGAEEVAVDEGPAAVLDDSDEDADAEEDDAEEAAEPVAEPKPEAAPKKRRTAAQVEAEAAEREEALQRQIDELKGLIEGKADVADIAVVRDKVVLEDGVGGDVRVLGNGKTLANDDWRATVDGLRLILGRASSQSTQSIQLPVSLIPSLAELLGCIDEIDG